MIHVWGISLIQKSWAWLTAAPIRFLYIALLVIGLFLVWGIGVYIIHKRHDRHLEEEKKKEAAPPPTTAMKPRVSVIGDDATVEENTAFMPVPGQIFGVVDFVSQKDDGTVISDSIRYGEVNSLMSDEEAERLTALVIRPLSKTKEKAVVYLDDLSDAFSQYSYVNLPILRDMGMVGEEADYLVVHGRGTLRKSLMIEANEFSLEAVKMIALTGGRPILIQKEQ